MLLNESKLLILADKVVNRYINKGVIPSREKEDTQMLIVEKFILKQEIIQKNYSEKSNITTYCISVLNNMCCEIIRKDLKYWKNELEEIPEKQENHGLNTMKNIIIQDEIKYLDKILNLFGSEKHKIRLALCYYYMIQIQKQDIINYAKNSNATIKELNPNTKINKSEKLNNLAIFVNSVENKNIKPDAIRMWLNKIINIIIDRLNSPFNRANYNKESFLILYELYILPGKNNFIINKKDHA